MGLLDKILGNDEPAKKADFSDVQSGSSSTAPAPAQTSSAGASAGRTYTVVSGDSLSKIAKHHYGDANKYNAIFEANRPMLSHPDKIYPGQKLRIPAQP